jgi:hypothetical protein
MVALPCVRVSLDTARHHQSAGHNYGYKSGGLVDQLKAEVRKTVRTHTFC